MPKLKLSDAIMLNGVSKPQGYGEHSVKSIEAPCAIGGALQAIGKQHTGWDKAKNYTEFAAEWHWTANALKISCPACQLIPFNAMEAIWHLNDLHRWTRQQIAEWVARIEPVEIPADVTCEATVEAEVVNELP